ncbi:hypothetical protein [Glaciimonas sp. CA11.2]|uniref:hypothetical protein n=1 Tax=Glaciimonas sp. CA11.2 TaxID=3048601 RepID=UPI003A0FEE68
MFGDYVSRYDFKRSEEDGATVKLVYDNRGEKLGLARLDLNDKIAAVDLCSFDHAQGADPTKIFSVSLNILKIPRSHRKNTQSNPLPRYSLE